MTQYYKYFHHKPILNDILSRLPFRKYILTNGSESHADKVVSTMGIKHHFKKTLAIDTFGMKHSKTLCKPNRIMYLTAHNMFNLDPKYHIIWFFDDQLVNLRAAKEHGWRTVYIHSKDSDPGTIGATPYDVIAQALGPGGYVDYMYEDIMEALLALFSDVLTSSKGSSPALALEAPSVRTTTPVRSPSVVSLRKPTPPTPVSSLYLH